MACSDAGLAFPCSSRRLRDDENDRDLRRVFETKIEGFDWIALRRRGAMEFQRDTWLEEIHLHLEVVRAVRTTRLELPEVMDCIVKREGSNETGFSNVPIRLK